MGFTLRRGFEQFNPYVNFSPRPRGNRYVRRVGFTADADLQNDTAHDPLTRVWNFTALNVDFQSQDTFSFLVIPEYQRLNTPFAIYRGVTLPVSSEYNFVHYRFTAGTANRRLIAISPTVEWGGFYSGTRERLAADVTVRARPGVIWYFSEEWNKVTLAEGRFQTRLHRVTPEFQFGQWVSFVNTVQFDSVSNVLGWQSRFRWIFKPGNDLFVVYTHNWLNDAVLDRYTTLNRAAASKVVYARRF
jgi:hypothetical protein